MEALRTLQQQLSLALSAAKDATAAAANASVVPDAGQPLQTLVDEVRRLQLELHRVTSALVTQIHQHHKSVATTGNEADAVAVAGASETETEDEGAELKRANPKKRAFDGENTQAPPRKRSNAPKEQLKDKLQLFIEATDKAIESLKTEKGKLQPVIIATPFGMCRGVANIFIAMLKDGDSINDASAGLYRDTTAKLATIMLDERTCGLIAAKTLSTLFERIGELAILAEAAAEVPAALLDPVLKETQIKVKKYVEEHDGDAVREMQAYVKSFENVQESSSEKTLEDAFYKTLLDIEQDARHAMAIKELGFTSRSEETWTIFTEITAVIGNWIEGIALHSDKSKRINAALGCLKQLSKEYPGRVSPILLKNAALRKRSWRAQSKKNKKKTASS